MKKSAAIYVRVSTPDQHVESQLYDLRELAAQRGFEVVHEYDDRGVCGKNARRPGLDALMADARRKKFSVVLVAAFDRIARSTRNFLQVIDELDSMGIEFISRRENVDTSGPMGRLFVTIISAIAELERSLVADRVRSGMRRAKLEGPSDREIAVGCESRASRARSPLWDVADAGRQAPQHFESLSVPPDERGEQRLQSRRCNSQRRSWAGGSALKAT